MTLPGFIEIPLRLGLLLAGLLLPGAMILRVLRLPWSLAGAFVTSCATLYVTVVALACTGGPISTGTLAAALGTIALLARLVPVRGPATSLPPFRGCFTRMDGWTPLYAAFWLVVAYRLVAHPLGGPDVYFRWSYLAEQMLRFGSLDFYPPRSGGDFVRYFWAESVPPGVAGVYAWAYGCGGSRHALWTSPVVLLQLLSLHEIVWRLAVRWGGEAAGRRGLILAAACPLLTWTFFIGQESGLTAVAVAGLVWCLQHAVDEKSSRWAVATGIFALAASGTREYGPVFLATAIGAAGLAGLSRRQLALLALFVLPVAAWPLHVWYLTGNPVYSLAVGGLFPHNAVFTEWLVAFRSPHQSQLAAAAGWLSLGRYLLLWALPALAGLAALPVLLVRGRRDWQTAAFISAVMIGLWWFYVAYAAGGLFYSLRMLSPALALWVAVAAWAVGRVPPIPVLTRATAAALALLAVESLPKTLVLPENPYRIEARDWLNAGGRFSAMVRAEEEVLRDALRPLPGRERVVSDDAGMSRALAAIGTGVVPPWSPDIAWLFDRQQPPGEVARRWRESGLRYLVLGRSGPTASFMANRSPLFGPSFVLHIISETDAHVILEATVAPADKVPAQ